MTFVLGAGASKEFGFPLGNELTGVIAKLLDMTFDRVGVMTNGDRLIYESIGRLVTAPFSVDHSPAKHIYAAWSIRDAMPLASSIDTFIDSRRGDALIEVCGKLAIVRSILEAERGSKLYVDAPGAIQQNKLTDTWLNSFWKLFSDGCTIEEAHDRAKSVSFIIFNYDRCVEHYLFHAARSYYGLDEPGAADLLGKISFYHPYGSIGALPWMNKSGAVGFGETAHAQTLLDSANRIKTFTEGTDPNSSEIDAIRDRVDRAERIVFLGFAYHEQNLELLWPVGPRAQNLQSRTFGTAVGLSPPDIEQIRLDLANRSGRHHGLMGLNRMTCQELFHEYNRTLEM